MSDEPNPLRLTVEWDGAPLELYFGTARNRERYDRATPKEREQFHRAVAASRTPERRAEYQRVRELIDREVRETGGIRLASGEFVPVKLPDRSPKPP